MRPNQNCLDYAALRRPTIFAHRGACAYAPENTLAAFKLAIDQGADAIELDAMLCADGQVVVIHDQTVDRTTNGSGRVNELTFPELQRLDVCSQFKSSFTGEKIPSLEKVFESIGNHIFIDVELKNYASPTNDLPDRVVRLVKKFGLDQSVMFSSFNPIALIRAHRSMPDVPIGLLTIKGKKGALARSFLGRLIPHQALHPAWIDTNPTLIRYNHQRGYRVHPYTVNEPAKILELFNAGVDGIFTDDPMLAIKILADYRSSRL